ncbi:MAG: tannase/feruloyl esterase family alpha/beta hydrolase [bacterium]
MLPLLLLSILPAAQTLRVEHGGRVSRTPVDCAAAVTIALPNARVTAVNVVQPTDSLRALGQRHCRVEATIDEETHIVALLPNEWNGQFLMGGAGGYVGAVQNQFESTVHEGYATVGADAAHSAFSLSAAWALHDDTCVADYAHRSVHHTAEVTKLLIAAYDGRSPEHSFFIGCWGRSACC